MEMSADMGSEWRRRDYRANGSDHWSPRTWNRCVLQHQSSTRLAPGTVEVSRWHLYYEEATHTVEPGGAEDTDVLAAVLLQLECWKSPVCSKGAPDADTYCMFIAFLRRERSPDSSTTQARVLVFLSQVTEDSMALQMNVCNGNI